MTREPLSTEITAQDALARAVAYIRTNDDPQADFTNLDFYRVGIRLLSGVYDGTCEGAYYCVNFDALDAFGTTYEVAVNAEDGSICRMRRERGAGSNHTADEVTRGFRRIFGYDMRTWTPMQLRVYILALSRADRSSMQTVHELFLSVGRDGFPDVPAEALTREEVIDAALAIQGGSSSDVLAAEYLAGASSDFWKIAIRQPNAPSGQSIVYLELNGLTGGAADNDVLRQSLRFAARSFSPVSCCPPLTARTSPMAYPPWMPKRRNLPPAMPSSANISGIWRKKGTPALLKAILRTRQADSPTTRAAVS